jgi:hypothetical protein
MYESGNDGAWVADTTATIYIDDENAPITTYFVVQSKEFEVGEWNNPHVAIGVMAVAPDVVSDKKKEPAIWDKSETDVRRIAYQLAEYGIGAPIGEWIVSPVPGPKGMEWDRRVLRKDIDYAMAQARRTIAAMPMMIGFALDQTVNRIGSSGWDFIQGNLGMGFDRGELQ